MAKRFNFFKNMSIGWKLNIGFGILVLLTLQLSIQGYLNYRSAGKDIEQTSDFHAPIALASARAQSNLLKMQSNVHAYLALSSIQHIDRYRQAKEQFERELTELDTLSGTWKKEENVIKTNLAILKREFAEWKPIVARLFKLHNTPKENRPAYIISSKQLSPLRFKALQEIDAIVREQHQRLHTKNDIETLINMVSLRNAIMEMTTNVQACASSGDLVTKMRYGSNLMVKGKTWRLLDGQKDAFSKPQLSRFHNIKTITEQIETLSVRIFEIVDGEHAYEDLYLFRNQASLVAAKMLAALDQLTLRQQLSLQNDLNNARNHLDRSLSQTKISGLLTVILGVVLSFLIKRSIAVPLLRLTNIAEQITQGNIDAKATVDSNDEIGRLAFTFNMMTGQLKDTIKSLKQGAGELEQRAIELSESREKAQAANKAKSDFLANMSHEIRTPMNAVLGFTEILKNIETDNRKFRYIESIHTSGHALLKLINDILDLSKIEAGKLELQYSEVSIESLFNEIKTVFDQKITDKGLRFILETGMDIPQALILDEIRLRQILFNLVSNAAKFTEYGSVTLSAVIKVPIKAARSQVDFILSVSDTGVGIPEDQCDKIFDAFEQQKAHRGSQYGGTGLGLAITKRLIEAMGGNISVVSRVGKGSTFVALFQGVEVATATALAELEKPEFDCDAVAFERAKILVVDDIHYNRDLMKGYLDTYGFDLMEAGDGKQAIDKARQYIPDLILLDMKMPEMDGYEAADVLGNDPALKDIPVIAITASALKQDEERIRKICDGYLPKPVSRFQLIKEIMQFLPHILQETRPREGLKTVAELTPETMAGLPKDMLKDLKDAAVRLDAQAISKAVDRIRGIDSSVADALAELARDYQYDKIINSISAEE